MDTFVADVTAAAGAYFNGTPVDYSLMHPNGFGFKAGVTPFTSPVFLALSVPIYIAISFLLQALMRGRQPFVLTPVVVVHNAILCIGSLIMFVGVVREMFVASQTYSAGKSVLELLCDDDGKVATESNVEFWIYVYYLSKFYEMIDTFILALKKKPLTFLQMYHHAVIGPLTWTWLVGGFTMSVWGVGANTLVHVFMYYYFAQTALGHRVWWKKYMTAGQLVQFSSVFVLVNYFLYNVKDLKLSPTLPFYEYSSSKCHGDVWVVIASQAVNVSFLYLFGSFFFTASNFQKGKKSAEKKKQ